MHSYCSYQILIILIERVKRAVKRVVIFKLSFNWTKSSAQHQQTQSNSMLLAKRKFSIQRRTQFKFNATPQIHTESTQNGVLIIRFHTENLVALLITRLSRYCKNNVEKNILVTCNYLVSTPSLGFYSKTSRVEGVKGSERDETKEKNKHRWDAAGGQLESMK